MDYKKQETEKLQWHPALYAGLQIELREDSDNLIFENEHQLGTKPKQIINGSFLYTTNLKKVWGLIWNYERFMSK